MTLSEFASFAEIVSAVGVIASLIFLAIEIRKSTTATRQQSYHSFVTRRSALLYEGLAESREMADIFAKGVAAEELDAIDSQRFLTNMVNLMSHFQDVYMQYRAGIVEPEFWAAERRIVAALAGQKGFSNWWREASQYYLPEFIEEVARVEPLNLVVFDPKTRDWSRPAGVYPTGH